MMFATDTVALGDVRVNDAGYLEGFAKTARTGVQQYLGIEMGRPDLGVVNVYRDESEVFSKTSLQSFAQIPLTVDHPPEAVNSANWKKYAVGTTGNDVIRDGEHLKIGLKIKDAAAIAAINSGKRELSVGYSTEIDWKDGVAPDGTPFQAVQRAIKADHIAIVSAGRAGSACRFGDSWAALGGEGTSAPIAPHPDPKLTKDGSLMKTHMIGDNAVEMSDAAIVAVKGLQAQLGTLTADNLKLATDVNTLTADHKKALETKDGEILKLQAEGAKTIETKDAEIAKLKGEAITADKLDAAIAERASVMDAAKPILGATFDAKGKTVADIRRATVAKRLGDKAVEGKTDEHVAIAFDTLTAVGGAPDAIAASVRDAANPSNPNPTLQLGDANAEYARMLERDRNAWTSSQKGH